MLNTAFISLLNEDFIHSNIPNLEAQQQLLKDRFEKKKANGYNFELVETKKKPDTVKFSNRINLEDREYSLKELSDLVFALNEGLIDGIIREADSRNAKTITLMYGLESLLIPWGVELTESKGHILFRPAYKSFNYITAEKDIPCPPDLIGTILVDFDK